MNFKEAYVKYKQLEINYKAAFECYHAAVKISDIRDVQAHLTNISIFESEMDKLDSMVVNEKSYNLDISALTLEENQYIK